MALSQVDKKGITTCRKVVMYCREREANNITVQLKDILSQNDYYAHNIMTTNLDL